MNIYTKWLFSPGCRRLRSGSTLLLLFLRLLRLMAPLHSYWYSPSPFVLLRPYKVLRRYGRADIQHAVVLYRSLEALLKVTSPYENA